MCTKCAILYLFFISCLYTQVKTNFTYFPTNYSWRPSTINHFWVDKSSNHIFFGKCAPIRCCSSVYSRFLRLWPMENGIPTHTQRREREECVRPATKILIRLPNGKLQTVNSCKERTNEQQPKNPKHTNMPPCPRRSWNETCVFEVLWIVGNGRISLRFKR